VFVDTSRVAVTEGEDTIYVKARMDFETQSRVRDALARFGTSSNGEEIMVTLGAQNLALMVHNIVAWEGPGFTDAAGRPVPCTRENVGRLDPDEPIIDKVLAKINELNAPRDRSAAEEKKSTTPTAPGSAARKA